MKGKVIMNEKKTKIFDLDKCELSDRNGMYGGLAGS